MSENKKLKNPKTPELQIPEKNPGEEQKHSNTQTDNTQRRKFPVWARILVILTVIIVLPVIAAGVIFSMAGIGNYGKTAASFIFPDESKIQSHSGRVNLAVLGIGGKGHEGADLTDSIIFASFSLSSHSATLVSVPRDLWIPEIRAKINSAYYWGQVQPERGGGMPFAKEIISEVSGQKVDYALVIDFSGFKDIIDTIGGIDVNVERSFTDNKYPVAGKENDPCGGDLTYACRYKTISFEKGTTHMDGETALEFARSREGNNDENTDFARSARQQKIISAVSKKVLSFRTIINPAKDYKILVAVKKSVETDLTPDVIGILARNVIDSRGNITPDTFPTDLVKNPPISPTYDNQYVLIPKEGNGKWGLINKWFAKALGD